MYLSVWVFFFLHFFFFSYFVHRKDNICDFELKCENAIWGGLVSSMCVYVCSWDWALGGFVICISVHIKHNENGWDIMSQSGRGFELNTACSLSTDDTALEGTILYMHLMSHTDWIFPFFQMIVPWIFFFLVLGVVFYPGNLLLRSRTNSQLGHAKHCAQYEFLLRQLSTDHRVAHNHNRKETHQHCTFATCLDLIGQQAVLWNICIWPTNMSNIIFKYFVFFFFSVCISLLSFFAPQFTVRSLGRRWWSTSNCRDRPAATGHSGILPCQLCHWWWVEKFQ